MGSRGLVLRSIGVGVFPVWNVKLKDVNPFYPLMDDVTVQNQRLVHTLTLCLFTRDIRSSSIPTTDQEVHNLTIYLLLRMQLCT